METFRLLCGGVEIAVGVDPQHPDRFLVANAANPAHGEGLFAPNFRVI